MPVQYTLFIIFHFPYSRRDGKNPTKLIEKIKQKHIDYYIIIEKRLLDLDAQEEIIKED